MNSPIPIGVLYAGLAGTVLALIIATIQQRWSPRVFFLLALRLAIGWQFLFEGLYKINSHYAGPGPSGTTRPFTSEPYFRAAPGPIGAYMRRQFEDPSAIIAEKVKPTAGKDFTPEAFKKLSEEQQAEACPESVAKELSAMQEQAEAALKNEVEADLKAADAAEEKAKADIDATEQRALKGEWTPEEIDQIRAKADADRSKAQNLADGKREQLREQIALYQKIGKDLTTAIKAEPDSGMLVGQLEAVLKANRAKAEKDIETASAAEKKALDEATATEFRALKGAWTDAEKTKIKEKAEEDRKKAKEKADKAREAANKAGELSKDLAPKRIRAAKAEYARWVYGAESRSAKVKSISGDVMLTAPQRLEHLDWLRKEVKAGEDQQAAGLGNGYGTEQKRAAELRMDLLTAESDLAKDANAFVAELKKALNGGKAVEEQAAKPFGETMDKITMWFLVAVGACLMAGLLTRLACVLAAGFLVVTYLAHPPFPWYPQPPNTEGNPIFINKNIIECIALLALACMPTGRWLGLDALVLRRFCRYKGECEQAPAKTA
jgi:uncharacterized membrane protein YphA (DoxX/SURF4 family)